MKQQYKYLIGSSDDDIMFSQRVTEALNNGWNLYGHPTLTYDIKERCVVCGQALIKLTDEKQNAVSETD